MLFLKNNSKLFLISFLIVLFANFVEAKPADLTPSSTHKKALEILKAHVLYKEFTPELAKHTLKNFLEELDPLKTYLFESETSKWIEPSPELLNQLVSCFKKGDFHFFQNIHAVMIQAIERRNKLENTLTLLPLKEGIKSSDFKDLKWAKDLSELENRWQSLRNLQLEVSEKLNIETQDQFLRRLNKSRLSRELEITQKSDEERQKQLLVYFLKAFTSALDNHTAYFTPSEASQFIIQVQQRLFGIGAQLRDDLNGFTLVSLLEGGPAMEDGTLKVGDRIVAVNKSPVVGMDITDAVDLIRGPKGTAVTLTILRDSKTDVESEKIDIEIIRDEVVLKETRFDTATQPFGDGVIAHISLFSFYQDPNNSSTLDIKKTLEKIKENQKLYGVILDLRWNAGGLLPQAVEVAGLFIQKGVVVSIKDSSGNIQHLRNFNGNPSWSGPLMVLTNKGSASAAEIVAQTLQDYGRALLVGDPYTWGKGSYQTFTLETEKLNQINPQGEYKVTRGLYYTVSGKSPQLTGTKVNLLVPGALAEAEIGESFSKFPIKNDEIPPNFTDNLSDIHPFHREKMMKMYKNNKQQQVDLYGKYLPTLSTNSQKRIAENKDYQNFIRDTQKSSENDTSPCLYGQNDLQLEETFNIMKDLILLSYQKTFEIDALK